MRHDKIKNQTELCDIVRLARKKGTVVGFSNGCFDLLHAGHVRYLKEARKACGLLVIGMNSDASVKRIKGENRPLNPQDDRLEVLSSLESVDYLTLFEEDTPEQLIKMLTPDVLFKGGDWKEEDVAGAEHVKSHGGVVKIIPYVEGYSTTELIEKMRNSG